MKRFWCGALIPNCSAKFEGQDEQDILRQVAAHAAKDHGIAQVPHSVVEQVRTLIREAS
jgi:predicted small metal-binding protein